jgi:hypothetical protein
MKMLCLSGILLCGFACARPAPPEEPEYKGQSYREALDTICRVDSLAGLADEADPLERSQKREDWLSERVKNPDAIYFRTMLKVQSAAEKSASLRDEAKKAGLGHCPLAETIDDEEL